MVWIVCLMSLLLFLHSLAQLFLAFFPSFQLFHTVNARLSTCSIFLPCPEPLNEIRFCCKSFIVFDSVWEILYALTFSSSTCISVVGIVVLHCTALHCTAIVCLCFCLYFCVFFFELFAFFHSPLSFFDLCDFIFALSFTLYSHCFSLSIIHTNQFRISFTLLHVSFMLFALCETIKRKIERMIWLLVLLFCYFVAIFLHFSSK